MTEHESEIGSESEPSQPGPTALPHFTQITHYGCNLLGLVNVFAFIGLMTTIIERAPDNRFLRAGLLVLIALACCAFDVWMRLLSPGEPRWRKLRSTHAGGALVFIPVWAIYPAFLIAIPLVVLHHR